MFPQAKWICLVSICRVECRDVGHCELKSKLLSVIVLWDSVRVLMAMTYSVMMVNWIWSGWITIHDSVESVVLRRNNQHLSSLGQSLCFEAACTYSGSMHLAPEQLYNIWTTSTFGQWNNSLLARAKADTCLSIALLQLWTLTQAWMGRERGEIEKSWKVLWRKYDKAYILYMHITHVRSAIPKNNHKFTKSKAELKLSQPSWHCSALRNINIKLD